MGVVLNLYDPGVQICVDDDVHDDVTLHEHDAAKDDGEFIVGYRVLCPCFIFLRGRC